jgi:hypothetical protein
MDLHQARAYPKQGLTLSKCLHQAKAYPKPKLGSLKISKKNWQLENCQHFIANNNLHLNNTHMPFVRQ